MKAEIFNIKEKKDCTQTGELDLTPEENLILCLDLMDLSIELSQNKNAEVPADESFPWINLYPLLK